MIKVDLENKINQVRTDLDNKITQTEYRLTIKLGTIASIAIGVAVALAKLV